MRFHSNEIENMKKMAIDLIDERHKEAGDLN